MQPKDILLTGDEFRAVYAASHDARLSAEEESADIDVALTRAQAIKALQVIAEFGNDVAVHDVYDLDMFLTELERVVKELEDA